MTPDPAGPAAPRPERIPLWPLLATMAMQTLATMAAYSLPALAPMVARDLAVPGPAIGYFVSMVYGVGILSALYSPGFIHRYGATRVGQVVLLATLAMILLLALGGSVAAVIAAAVTLGLAYGATAPVSAHLLVPRTPLRVINLVLSVRQIGVPLGGVLGALMLPPLALAFGWKTAILLEAIPAMALLALLQVPRRDWDADRKPGGALLRGSLSGMWSLLKHDARLRRLSVASFVYSGVQLCFVAFMTVHLTSKTGMDLVAAGRALATYQITGVVTRPVWGWLADRLVPARWLLAVQGLAMAAAAAAAGRFGEAWPGWTVLAVVAIAGATASGYTGIAYAEFARLGGERRTEATGLGSGVMFAGVMAIPSLASLLVTSLGGYEAAYSTVAVAAALCGLLLMLPAPAARPASPRPAVCRRGGASR
jgi:predicted MFS family arabinose efflux permease